MADGRWPELFEPLDETQRREVLAMVSAARQAGIPPCAAGIKLLVDEVTGAVPPVEEFL